MKNAIMFSILAALSVGAWTPQASAAVKDRDAAITSCIARAHNQYPQKPNYDYGKTRQFVYESCMFDAGQAP